MPERGWTSITVRDGMARRVKETSLQLGITIGTLVNSLINLWLEEGWVTCGICGVRVKAKNLEVHVENVHHKTS